MLIIGLTGGTGSGKGRVCQLFSKLGINSIDTDKVAREVCNIGKPCLDELVNVFGSQILNNDKSLNRKKLASIVFSDKEKLQILNSITHRYILGEARIWLNEQKQTEQIAAIVDAPLLFESGFDKECDVIISVIADKSLRTQRLIERDNITTEEITKRINNQHDDKFYTDNADYVIVNNGSLSDLEISVKQVYDKLFKKDTK